MILPMPDDVDVLERTLAEYKYALKIREVNEELYEQLLGSVEYLLNYAKKHDIILPKRDLLLEMIERSERIMTNFNRKFTENGVLRRLYRATYSHISS